jgi:dethiobiotin synthetase
MARPERLVVVLGADTAVGKTWLSAALLRRLRSTGSTVAARKPVQSFAPCDDTTDADVLAAASDEAGEDVCPRHRWYAMAMAPPMAAAFLGVQVPTLDELVTELTWPAAAVDVGLVETVGGPRSPLAADGDSADLAFALRPDLAVLVAHAGLGAINAVRLSAAVLDGLAVAVFLNHFDHGDLPDRNRRWLQHDGFDVHVDPVTVAARIRNEAVPHP